MHSCILFWHLILSDIHCSTYSNIPSRIRLDIYSDIPSMHSGPGVPNDLATWLTTSEARSHDELREEHARSKGEEVVGGKREEEGAAPSVEISRPWPGRLGNRMMCVMYFYSLCHVSAIQTQKMHTDLLANRAYWRSLVLQKTPCLCVIFPLMVCVCVKCLYISI